MNINVAIRPMKPEDKPALKQIAGRAFPPFQQAFISWTEHTFVAEAQQGLVGAVVLKLYPLAKETRGGCVSWIFTDPDVQGSGVGQGLLEHALEYLERLGCQEITTCIDGYNASSSKLFSTRGFEILPMGAQIKRYGLRLLPTWFAIFHYLDIGFFLWARPAGKQDQRRFQWCGSLLMNILIACLALLRAGSLIIDSFLYAAFSCLTILGLRTFFMQRAARAQGLQTRYRSWETGFVLSTLIALLSGGVFLVPGSLYPASHAWSLKDMKPSLAKMAIAGILPILVLATATTIVQLLLPVEHAWQSFVQYINNAAIVFSLFDVLLIIFPFQVFNGRRIWDWSKWAWLPLAAWTVALLLL